MAKRIVALAALAVTCIAPVVGQQTISQSAEELRTIALVKRAADLLERRGKTSAFAEFRKPNSEWFHDDTYLFAYDMALNVLLNAAFPEREGRNLAGQHDATGKAVHDEILSVVTANRAAWVDSVIARPGSTAPARKRVYVVSVMIDGRPGILGSGFYPQ
jgi:cytochrome c